MKTSFQKYAGDKADFALEIFFHPDPDPSSPVTEEERASWGHFNLWLGGRNISAHLENGEEMEGTYWHLLSLLEWFVKNWDPLLHEERLPVANAGDHACSSCAVVAGRVHRTEEDADAADEVLSSWWRRHNIRAAREGGLYPDLYIRRLRDEIEFSWGDAPLSGMPVHYRFVCDRGVHRVTPEVVAHIVRDVVKDAGEYLACVLPQSARLRNFVRDIGKVARGKQETRLMWLAGLGVTVHQMRAGWRRGERELQALGNRGVGVLLRSEHEALVISGSPHATLMFGSLAPDVKAEDLQLLTKHVVDSTSAQGDSSKLRDLVRSEPVISTPDRPWEQGYALAQDVLERLGLIDGAASVDVDRLLSDLYAKVEEITLSDTGIRGVAIAGEDHRPVILLNTVHGANQYPSGRRFSLAHEFCHILFDRTRGRRLSMASGPWAPQGIEQRANAFAAMLLMPSELVRRAISALSHPLATLDGLTGFCQRLLVSHRAALWHLHNLGFIDEAARDHLDTGMDRGMRHN